MAREPALTPQQRDNLDIIGHSGEHLLGLINDVLEMSKIESGRATLQEESFDLYRMLDGLEEMFSLRARDKGLLLIVDRDPAVPRYVRADQGKLRQVLMNLLGNAIKFTSEGGVTLRVRQVGSYADEPTTTTQRDDGAGQSSRRLEFEVQDTGPGIAAEEMGVLFDPFVQTASGQKSQEGTGLGLSISRQFVRLMGGELTAASELGIGSVFSFYVEVTPADASEIESERGRRRVIGLAPDQPVDRLLVAEDRDTNRRLLVKMLVPMGFEVREAINGQEALDAWERWKPHLIWMDLRMPVMDGREATRRIKATPQGQATVVVALTASAFEEDRKAILAEGCDDFVRKPFRENEIFDVLAQHLGVRFVYEEPTGAIDEDLAAASTRARELSRADLAGLPNAWRSKLHRAATRLDSEAVDDLIAKIRAQHGPLADALTVLAHEFRFDTIMSLSEPTEENNEPRSD
jgi:CheY-like chemotaxis protein